MQIERWSDRIEAHRHRCFVGRAEELARFSRFLDDPSLRLLHVWGQGGIGKTTLLGEFARLAQERGLAVERVDARTLPLAPSLLAEALRGPADVLLIDELQALAPLEPWLRTECFPTFPSTLRVITARREPLGTEWRTDPGFRELMASIELGILPRSDCEDYLERCGVDRPAWDEILTFARGLPLALSLATDGRGSGALVGAELVGTLLGRLLRDVADPSRRRALEVAALNRVATPALLADVLGEDDAAETLFDWLRSRAFTRVTNEGVVVHDVLREAVLRDLAWRDEPRRRAIMDRSLAHHLAQHGPGHPVEYRGAMRSVIEITEIEGALALDALGAPRLIADALRDADRAPILEAIEGEMGPAERRYAERYMDLERAGALVGRAPDGSARAFLQFIELPSCRYDDDPAAMAFARWLEARAPLTEAERALLCRLYLPIGAISPYDGFLMMETILRLFATPGVAISASVQPLSYHDDHPEYAFHTLVGTVESGGRTLTVVGHDLRDGTFGVAARASASERLAFVRGALGGAPSRDARSAAPEVTTDAPLSREAFEAEIRRALKSYHRRDKLAKSSLVRARFLDGDEGVEALRRALAAACAGLGDRGADALHARVLVATYLADARKQLAVAQDLGMAYSTLRKHLADATLRVVDALWEAETGAERARIEADG